MMDWKLNHKKRIYSLSEGAAEDTRLLGIKGANLCEMRRLNLPVPKSFTITTEACIDYIEKGLDSSFSTEMEQAVNRLEKKTDKYLGGKEGINSLPLLLSVRSGAAVEMQGMMETILNLGMNDETVEKMAKISNNPIWAYDCYRRFLQMYGSVVSGMNPEVYEEVLTKVCVSRGVVDETMLDEKALKEVVMLFKEITPVPSDPWEQLMKAVQGVFKSWFSQAATRYRDAHNISSSIGVAVTVQVMVHGNFNSKSGTGLASTHDPETGVPGLFGEFLSNAVGEEVLRHKGTRAPVKLQDLKMEMPKIFEELQNCEKILTKRYHDMQDLEFTIEDGKLYLLESKTGKRSPRAAVAIVVDLVRERVISEREALMRINPAQMEMFLHPVVDPLYLESHPNEVKESFFAKGYSAATGAVAGKLVFTSEDAKKSAENKEKCILCLHHSSDNDISGFKAAAGVLVLQGGWTCHAAVAMRKLGKPCITDLGHLTLEGSVLSCVTGSTIPFGEFITLDGTSGTIYSGILPLKEKSANDNFYTLLQWASKYSRLKILANVDSVEEVKLAKQLGAEGIGLLNTAKMFLGNEKINLFRKIILATTEAENKTASDQLFKIQKNKFMDLFRPMDGKKVSVQLLDPPLSQFLPNPENENFEFQINELAGSLNIPHEVCLSRIKSLQSKNSMLGLRGSRLSIVFPEITFLQTKAIIAARECLLHENIKINAQILLPFLTSEHEIDLIAPNIISAVDSAVASEWVNHEYQSTDHPGYNIGSIIEIPSACIRAERIAKNKHVKFVTIGTNELTQLVFGLSKDDLQHFLPTYLDHHLFARNPFVSLDLSSVGSMIKMAIDRCRHGNPHLQVGVFGDHGGDPISVHFFDVIGVDSISCPPFKIPVAKVAAAQSHIMELNKLHERVKDSPILPLPFL